MVFGLTSCEKDNSGIGGGGGNGSGSGGNINNSIAGTQWKYSGVGEEITLDFTSATGVEIKRESNGVIQNFDGSYTYSNGSGTISCNILGGLYNIDFTVSGNTLMASNTPSGNIVFTLIGGSNPQPNPNPGGGGSYPLNGTTWNASDGDVQYTLTFGTTNCELSVNGYTQMQGTYTYNGTLTSGQGTISLSGHSGTIAVSGNQATITFDGQPLVFTRGSNPQPNPNPGGGTYPLNGTSWQASFNEGNYYEVYTVTFSTTTVTFGYSDNYGNNEQIQGTYSYNGTLASGNGTMTIDYETNPFVVNGNQITIMVEDDPIVLTRIS